MLCTKFDINNDDKRYKLQRIHPKTKSQQTTTNVTARREGNYALFKV